MRRWIQILLTLCCVAALAARGAAAQAEESGKIRNAAIGGGLGLLGGAATTLSVVVARAQLQERYLDSVHDLFHWQSTPMIAGPVAGVVFGLSGEDVLVGSVVGSLSGMVVGTGVGAAIGWLVSEQAESPWAGGVIGAGTGLTVGALVGAALAWRGGEGAESDGPATALTVRIPL